MHVHIDHGPYYDDGGRRLPPYTRCWVSCDLCKKAGEVVYGDTDYDKGSARARANVVSVMPSTTGRPDTIELCETCRTVTIEYHSKRDDHGRYHFAMLWYAECQWDEQGKVYPPEDTGPHVRQRGQHFFCDPCPYIESYTRRGFKVVEVDKT